MQGNLNTLENYRTIYNEQAHIARRLQELKYSSDALPADTTMHYFQCLFGGRTNPHRFSTDALEMLKTSTLTSHIADKQQIVELLQCYNALMSVDQGMNFYFDMRRNVLTTYDDANPVLQMPTEQKDFIRTFDLTIADPKIQAWLCMVPRAFNDDYFNNYKEQIEAMIGKLKSHYK